MSEGTQTERVARWIESHFEGRVVEIARLLGHMRLSASHFVDNPASGRVLRKAGFQPTGHVAKRHSCGRGGAADCVMFALDLEGAGQMPVAA